MKRSVSEAGGWTFARYGAALDATPNAEIADTKTTSPDRRLLVEEAKALCTSGMLALE